MDNGDIADRIGDLAISRPALVLICTGKLDPIVCEFETEEDAAAYDLWFRAQLEEALASDGPLIPHEQILAETRAILEKHRLRLATAEQRDG